MTTVVFFHAHPDDEALLTGGTMARLAAEGHRVVLVVATDGAAGLAAADHLPDLAARRRAEVETSAAALGCSRVVQLGYADSGSTPATRVPGGFADVDVDEAAGRLAALLHEERAEVLVGYDANGGYGHPDHRQVHRVASTAAALAGTAMLLEATIDRRPLGAVLRVLRPFARLLRGVDLGPVEARYADPATITHRVDVRAHVGEKRAALRAHASQAGADRGVRTVGVLLALPVPLFRRACGHEWYVERGRVPGRRLLDDPLASLRARQPLSS